MRISLRNRILFTFVMSIVLLAAVGALFGTVFINRTTVMEEQRRVGVDLRSAWSVIQSKQSELSILVNVLGPGRRVSEVFTEPTPDGQLASLEAVRRQFGLDLLLVTDSRGRVLLRTLTPYNRGDDLSNDPFVSAALTGASPAGFVLLSGQRLVVEGGDLAERAYMIFEDTPMAKPRAKSLETAGLVMMAGAPVRDARGTVIGTICAGRLLNRNHRLVDDIRSIVFEGQMIGGRPIGTVTIFQWDVRIATNVILKNGNRALGTRVSAEVYDKVLENAGSWFNRAFVVNDWYISAYEPIRDIEGRVAGILYVGVLAKKYDEIRRNLWKIYGGISLVGILLVVLLGVLFARQLTRSVRRLAEGAHRISAGQLEARVPEPRTDDELRDLTHAFNAMAGSLKDREERLSAAREELVRTNATLQTLNRNYLEMLGFVSHELKNTLGVIYTSARTLAAGLAGPLNERQNVLVQGVNRNIDAAVSMTRKYLDLTRIEKGELAVQPEPIDLVKDVVTPVLESLEGALESRGAKLVNGLPLTLPMEGDPSLLQLVFKNLLDNALKYGFPGGRIKLMFKPAGQAIRFEVWNEGPGLEPEQIGRLFGKFVRFPGKQDGEGKGTGLGLFITRDIIIKHGGEIRAESEPGRWMSFIFTLPLKAAPAVASGETTLY